MGMTLVHGGKRVHMHCSSRLEESILDAGADRQTWAVINRQVNMMLLPT